MTISGLALEYRQSAALVGTRIDELLKALKNEGLEYGERRDIELRRALLMEERRDMLQIAAYLEGLGGRGGNEQ